MAHAVLTRDAADCAAYAAALAPLGLDAIATPVTLTAAADDPAALRRALIAERYDAVIVTSKRGAEAIVEAVRACGAVLPVVWVVGEASRRALDDAGIAAVHPAGVREGNELARAVAIGGARRVLYPRAAEGREEPIAILRAAGVHVDDVVAYRTVARAAGDPAVARGLTVLAAGDAAVCVVFAPSQVAALAALCGVALAELRTAWVAIGDTTAAALRAAGVGAAVADAPTPEGIAKAAASVYRSEP